MSGTAYWLYPILPFRIVASTIFPILEIAVYSSHRICHWCNNSILLGPWREPFEGVVFTTRLVFPPDYPLSPPKMRFTCESFTPMVSEKKNTLKRMKSSLLGLLFLKIFTFYIVFNYLFLNLLYKIMGFDLREMTSLSKSKNMAYHFNHCQKNPPHAHHKTHLHTMKVYNTQPVNLTTKVWLIKILLDHWSIHLFQSSMLSSDRIPLMT